MNTPLSWIKAYVPELECTDQEYMDHNDIYQVQNVKVLKDLMQTLTKSLLDRLKK